ncbi:hypothetical protein [Mycolicibacterium thermoresistibile]|uniref:hypothetical protein n=1 Tax=Mycolicibacterium thermoresistibile TaxID=1797 RepID=UPI001041CE6D|nr:hypothetical protein [Mycolicibacterium thermoresistibile]MCV7188115.1 hypothetical protein [Mycolicibacterium thermoresistibile]
MAVVGITAAVTLSVAGSGSDGNALTSESTSPDPATADIASADDDGPVTVITEDPTCAAQGPIHQTLAGHEGKGWADRDPAVPATEWTPDIRAQHESVAQAMRDAADQMVPLAKLTPHRVMRELYEQFIAYSRAYADSVPTYTPKDNNLARVSVAAGDAITNICGAVTAGSASARAPLVSPLPAPTSLDSGPAQENPKRFLPEVNAVCDEWVTVLDRFRRDTRAWAEIPANIPASEWTLARIFRGMLPLMACR